jgi:hypothetical protein
VPERFADAVGEVDGDACEFRAASFDLAGMDAHSHVDADLAGRVADRDAAANRAGRAVEGGEDAVTGVLLFVAREAHQLMAHGVIVAVEQRTPGTIADCCGAFSGADDVGEQQRGFRPR